MSTAALRKVAKASSPIPVLELPLSTHYTGVANRRFIPRAQAGFVVEIDGEATNGIDISFGGCMCVATPVWPGNTVDVILSLDGEAEPIPTKGTVVELVGQGDEVAMRLRFDTLSNARRKQIALWMARRAPTAR